MVTDIVYVQCDRRAEIFSIGHSKDAARSLPHHEIRSGTVSFWARDLGRPAGLSENAFGDQEPEILGSVMAGHSVLEHRRRHLIQQ
jgi:hypothetical protein